MRNRKGGRYVSSPNDKKEPGIFSAHKYFWLYYAVYPAVGVKLVPVGQMCKSPLEAHAILDPCDNADADSVVDSNSTYEFGGVLADQPGLLFTKTLPCVCSVCRIPSSIRPPPSAKPKHTHTHTHTLQPHSNPTQMHVLAG